MILETSPAEIPRLKRYNKLFQVVTWTLIGSAYAFSWLPLNVQINRLGIHLVVIAAALSELFIYNILPFEKRSGLIRYHYKLKGFVIGIMNHVLISAYLIFTGGIASPFVFIYYLPLVSAAIYLPLWAVIIEFTEASILYIIATVFIAPTFFGVSLAGVWALSIIPINISALAFIISLSYPQARELTVESEQNLQLAEKVSKQAREIEAERNKLKVMISAISDGVIALDNDTRIILINQAGEKITKLQQSEVAGKPIDEFIKIYEADKKISTIQYCPLTQPSEDRIVYFGKSLKIKTPEKIAFVNLVSTTIKEAKSANLGCLLTFQDVTREKQLEEMKIDFVSMAVHELRTPLTTIRGYISLLEQELVKKLPSQEYQDLKKVETAARQLAVLTENLLNVSRIERGAIKLEIKPTNWSELVASIVAEFEDLAKQKGLKLIYIKPGVPLPQAACDKFRISEVLSNLLSNAINFTKEGKVEVSVKRQDGEILTAVTDTGPGIPAEAVPNLFTKFFRVSGILEQGSKGTGLGLFIAKSIVELHGGKIWVDTKVGQGSTFYFTLLVYSPKLKPASNHLLQTKPTFVN